MNLTSLLIFATGLGAGWFIARLSRTSSSTPQVLSPPSAVKDISFGSPNDTLQSSVKDPVAALRLGESTMDERLQQLELAYQMAIEMGRFKAGFLARTSHELRSPLNSIMSLQQLILTDLCDGPEEEREFVSQSYAASQKLLALLNETTNISKLEEGTIDIALESLSLTNMLREVESLTRLQALNRNLKLIIEPPIPDVRVMGDCRWLRQVLVHLVTTAVYQMASGTITVMVQVNESLQRAEIYVEDERSPTAWSESIQLLEQSPEMNKTSHQRDSDGSMIASTGLTLTLTQIMMEKMNGELSLLTTSVQTQYAESEGTTRAVDANVITEPDVQKNRILCALPLAE